MHGSHMAAVLPGALLIALEIRRLPRGETIDC